MNDAQLQETLTVAIDACDWHANAEGLPQPFRDVVQQLEYYDTIIDYLVERRELIDLSGDML